MSTHDVVRDVVEAFEAGGSDLRTSLEALREEYRNGKHAFELRRDLTWSLQHPLPCRPNLLACPVQDAILHERFAAPPGEEFDWEPGVYEVEFVDGGLVRVGERLGP